MFRLNLILMPEIFMTLLSKVRLWPQFTNTEHDTLQMNLSKLDSNAF